MPQIFDVIANENLRYKRNELELPFSLKVKFKGRDHEVKIMVIQWYCHKKYRQYDSPVSSDLKLNYGQG